MAHFAEINEDNIVVNVLVIPDEEQHRGQEYLAEDMNLGGIWLQCSYNTFNNTHRLGGTPFRGNFPGVGHKYDSELDAFIEPKPEEFPSFVLDTDLLIWTPPIPRPEDGINWKWEEDSVSWVPNS